MLNKESKKWKAENRIGIKLRQLRVNSGYTQQNMADALNINRSTYTYYETGKTTPDISSLQKLSQIFDVRIESFLDEELTSKLESAEGRRPTKIPKDNPSKIGDLSSDEKSLIAMLRIMDKNDVKKIIDQIKEKLK